jgi:hypothetical protein
MGKVIGTVTGVEIGGSAVLDSGAAVAENVTGIVIDAGAGSLLDGEGC